LDIFVNHFKEVITAFVMVRRKNYETRDSRS
jgi:hypothetical protein